MRRALQMLNELEREGVFSRYAIGGAMAATFHVEPLLTFNLDAFVALAPGPQRVTNTHAMYEALRARGYSEEAECVSIEGVPVQFLPAYNALVAEAFSEHPK